MSSLLRPLTEEPHRSAFLKQKLSNWTTTGSLATARFSHTATLQISNAVLISGGRDATGALARSERYDEATGTCEGDGHARHGQIAAHGDAASLGYGPHRRGSRIKRLSPERRAVRRVVLV